MNTKQKFSYGLANFILILSVIAYSIMWIDNNIAAPQVIDVYGNTWYDLGYDYGQKCNNKIEGVAAVLDGLKNLLETTTNTTIEEYITLYQPFIPNTTLDFMQGIADGAGVTFNEIFLLNLFFDIYPDVFEGLGLSCSAFIITEKSPPSTGAFFGRTVDNAAISLMEYWQIILRLHPPVGNPIIIHTGAGFVGPLTGMNSKGVAFLVNFVAPDVTGPGMPMLVTGLIVLLYSNTTQDAVAFLNGTYTPSCAPQASGWNYGVLDLKGDAAIIETTHELVHVRWAKDEGNGWIGATNHYVSTEMMPHNQYVSESSQLRLSTIQLVVNNSNQFNLNDAMNLLRSHYDTAFGGDFAGHRSICNHDPLWSSMSAFIAAPKLNYTLVCIGHPCQNDFYLVSFDKILGPIA
ncbi:MAG: C45 family autoproteolytic acyltransferase/hydrolase [Candidatus Helarchaeota archaeon]